MGVFCLFYETRHVKLNGVRMLNENGNLQKTAVLCIET